MGDRGDITIATLTRWVNLRFFLSHSIPPRFGATVAQTAHCDRYRAKKIKATKEMKPSVPIEPHKYPTPSGPTRRQVYVSTTLELLNYTSPLFHIISITIGARVPNTSDFFELSLTDFRFFLRSLAASM